MSASSMAVQKCLAHARCFCLPSRAPFTLQRLCEVLLQPTRQYKSTNKLVAGLDKVAMARCCAVSAARGSHVRCLRAARASSFL